MTDHTQFTKKLIGDISDHKMSEEAELNGVFSDISTSKGDGELWADFDAVIQLSDFVEKSNSPTYAITLDGPQEVTSQHGVWKMPTGSTVAIRSTSRFEQNKPSAQTEKEKCGVAKTALSTDNYTVGISHSLSNRRKANFLTPCHRTASVNSYLRDATDATLTSRYTQNSATSDLGQSSAVDTSPYTAEAIDKQIIRQFYSDIDLSAPTEEGPTLHKVPSYIKLTYDPGQIETSRDTICSLDNKTPQWGSTGSDIDTAFINNDTTTVEKDDYRTEIWTKAGPKNSTRKKNGANLSENSEVSPVIRKKKTVIKRAKARLIVVRPAADVIDDTQDDSDSDVSDDDVIDDDFADDDVTHSVDKKHDSNGNRRRRSRVRSRRRKLKGVRLKFVKIAACFSACFRPCAH